LDIDNVFEIWLTASSELLETRIKSSSKFDAVSPDEQVLIGKFMARTDRYNDLMMQAVRRLGLVSIAIEPDESIDDLMVRCMARLFE
jgi:hypothetical protein